MCVCLIEQGVMHKTEEREKRVVELGSKHKEEK